MCVFFLVTNLAFSKQMLDKVVAIVNNDVITSSELDAQVELSKKQLMAQKASVPNEIVLRKQVLQHLVDVQLQMQLAKQNGLAIDATELNDSIERIATMNHIKLSQLREEIGKQGIGWEEYRETVRKEMLLARLQQKAVGREVQITNEQVEHYLKTAGKVDQPNLTYHLQNIVIPLSEAPTPSEIIKAKAQVSLLLDKIKKGADFSQLAIEQSTSDLVLEGDDLGERHLAELPDIFAREVIRMKKDQVVGPLRTGNGFQLIKLVAIGGETLQHVITQTHARHILLKSGVSMLPHEVTKQMNNLYQQLKSGKDFAVMAKQYSVDTVTAVKGGDLGWVNPGELVPEFEKAMNALSPNQISRPVKTQFGWHLIQVLARKQIDDSEGFKKQQVRQFLHQRKFAEAVQSWQQHLRTDAFIQITEKELA